MKTIATKSLPAIAGMFCALCAHAAPPAAATGTNTRAAASAAGTNDVSVFARYNGTWKTELTHLQTPYSKPSNETMTVKNDCWHSEVFYVCDQIIDGAPKALIVFFYNTEDKVYGSFPITAGSENVHRGEVLVDGNTIIFPWQINDNGKTIFMRIVNTFAGADAMDFKQEYSEDGKTWVPMATGVERRMADGKVSAKPK